MKILAALFVAITLLACSTTPTGRSQLNFMSAAQEMRLGADAYGEMLADEKLITSGPQYQMVQRIGKRIAQSAKDLYPDSDAKDFLWEFSLIDDPQMVNAWALPGGKCAVYTGLLPITQDEDSLAAVMGHEVAHAILHHGAERMSHSMVLQGALIGASFSMRKMDADERGGIMAALGVGTTVGIMLPFSRSHESEADEIGLYMAANAGYDPQAAVGLWQRMGALGGEKPPEWLSTHPSEETRIGRLNDAMPEALELYQKALKRGNRR
ncbi:MAG: M48 family metallopeptidase [Planctomycetota bacterium]|nr:M48 family metallopeptidase [Planctomycetota bacterium]